MALRGKTIVITRAASQSADLRNRLEEKGARVIESPTIQIVPPTTWKPVDDVIRRMHTYQWLLFTSANAVEQFMDRMGDRRPSIPIAVVGSATAAKVGEWGLQAALIPKEFRAEGLLDVFPENLVGSRSAGSAGTTGSARSGRRRTDRPCCRPGRSTPPGRATRRC